MGLFPTPVRVLLSVHGGTQGTGKRQPGRQTTGRVHLTPGISGARRVQFGDFKAIWVQRVISPSDSHGNSQSIRHGSVGARLLAGIC